MATVTKKDLVDRIAEQTGQKRTVVKDTIQTFLDQIIEELAKDNRLEFRDFGVFEVKERAARMAQNPKTLERVQVPAKRTVKFKVGRLMKTSVEDRAPETKGQTATAAKKDAVTVETKPETKPESRLESKSESKTPSKTETRPDTARASVVV